METGEAWWQILNEVTSRDVLLPWLGDHDAAFVLLGVILTGAWKAFVVFLRWRARRTETTEDDARVEALVKDVDRFYSEVKGMIPKTIKPPGLKS